MWSAAVAVALAGAAWAQEREAASPYFECPYVNFFDEGCPQLEKEQARDAPRAEGEAEEPETVDEEGDGEWPDDVPELLVPLFPKQSLAPDTPPLYRLLLMRPSLENARRYVRWHARRMARFREVQGLVDAAGREWLAERAAGE